MSWDSDRLRVIWRKSAYLTYSATVRPRVPELSHHRQILSRIGGSSDRMSSNSTRSRRTSFRPRSTYGCDPDEPGGGRCHGQKHGSMARPCRSAAPERGGIAPSDQPRLEAEPMHLGLGCRPDPMKMADRQSFDKDRPLAGAILNRPSGLFWTEASLARNLL